MFLQRMKRFAERTHSSRHHKPDPPTLRLLEFYLGCPQQIGVLRGVGDDDAAGRVHHGGSHQAIRRQPIFACHHAKTARLDVASDAHLRRYYRVSKQQVQ